MEFSRIYLDANILIAALGGDVSSDISEPLLDLIGSVGSTDTPPFATSELTLAESLVRAIRNGDEGQEQGFANALTSSGWLEVVPISRGILWAAASVRAKHRNIKLPDAIHLATALSANCPHTLTADTGLGGTFQVGAGREGQWIGGRVRTEIIRPDAETLQAIIAWLRS